MTARVFSPATDGIELIPQLMANLPAAANSLGQIFYVSDAPGGQALVVSDGANWRPFARGQQRMQATTNSSGVATFTFSPSYSAAPIPAISLGDTTSGELTYKISNLTGTGMTVTVKRSQKLPAVLTLLSALLNYDIFANPGVGVIVYLTAAPATQ